MSLDITRFKEIYFGLISTSHAQKYTSNLKHRNTTSQYLDTHSFDSNQLNHKSRFTVIEELERFVCG